MNSLKKRKVVDGHHRPFNLLMTFITLVDLGAVVFYVYWKGVENGHWTLKSTIHRWEHWRVNYPLDAVPLGMHGAVILGFWFENSLVGAFFMGTVDNAILWCVSSIVGFIDLWYLVEIVVFGYVGAVHYFDAQRGTHVDARVVKRRRVLFVISFLFLWAPILYQVWADDVVQENLTPVHKHIIKLTVFTMFGLGVMQVIALNKLEVLYNTDKGSVRRTYHPEANKVEQFSKLTQVTQVLVLSWLIVKHITVSTDKLNFNTNECV